MDSRFLAIPWRTATPFDAVTLVVKWQDKAEIAALANRPMRLQFDLSNAKLYAFQFLHGIA